MQFTFPISLLYNNGFMLNTLKKESFIWRQELTNSSIPEELLSELTNKSQIAVVTLYSDTDTG